MSRAQVTFPFIPKSNAYLRRGMFWPVTLDDGKFAAGVVLGVPRPVDPHQPSNSRIFVAGLLDWLGPSVPTERDLAGAAVLDWGTAHVKSISLTSDGTGILGAVPTEFNGVAMVSHRAGGTVAVYVNGEFARPATVDEAQTMPVFGTWGLVYLRGRARFLLAAD